MFMDAGYKIWRAKHFVRAIKFGCNYWDQILKKSIKKGSRHPRVVGIHRAGVPDFDCSFLTAGSPQMGAPS